MSKPSKLDTLLKDFQDVSYGVSLENPEHLDEVLKTAHTDILALVEEVIGPDIEDDPYMTVVNGTKAIQRLRKDAL